MFLVKGKKIFTKGKENILFKGKKKNIYS